MRALRAFAIQVSLARIASVSAKNDSDRQLLAIRIGATTKRFLPIYYCAFERNPLAVSGAKRDPCFYYDSAMVDYSTALFDLAMVALPVEDAKKLLNSVTGIVSGGAVNPLNIADLLESLVALGKDALKYGRVVGGLYRDTVELEVQVWLATPGIDRRPLGTRVTEEDVFALREVYDRKSDNMPAWIAEVAALRARGLEPVPHSKFFDQLGGLMRYICDLITTEAEASNACKVGLPTTLPPPMSALGTLKVSRVGSIRTSGLGEGGASGPSRTQKNGSSSTAVIKVDPAIGSDPIALALTSYVNSMDPTATNSPTKIIGGYIGLPDADTASEIEPRRSYRVSDVVSKPGYEKLRNALLKRACKENKITGPNCDLAK